MNSRLRTLILVAFCLTGWMAYDPASAHAQRGSIARAAVNQYMNNAYGGYNAYGYQPQYYGGYGYQPRYYSGYGYDNALPYGGNLNVYRSSYPAFGYNGGYNYGGYPAYTYGYRGAYYGY